MKPKPKPKPNTGSAPQKPKSSYSNIVKTQESIKRFKSKVGYTRGVNAIVKGGPAGGLGAQTGYYGSTGDSETVSDRRVGAGYIRMSKPGAIAARKAKVLRGTQRKAR